MKKNISLIIFIFLIFFCLSANCAWALDFSKLNPLGVGSESGATTADVSQVIGRMINAVLGVTGSFALFMIVYGGIILLTSQGKSDHVTKGKNIIIWATIGVIVILSSYALVNYIFTGIKEGGGSTGGTSSTSGTPSQGSETLTPQDFDF